MSELAFKFPTDKEAVRRVYGIEEELETPLDTYLPTSIYGRNKIAPGVERLEQFLTNGARFYKDTGQHMEYAVPEARTVREAVAATIAGELLLTNITESARPTFNQAEKVGRSSLNTRVIDDEGNTWGSHESYLTERNIDPSRKFVHEPLASYFATRALFAGAGVIFRSSDGHIDFRIAQKIWGLEDIVGSATTRAKPLVNTRDEPLADTNKYRRLHLIAGDPTMSPWATAYRLASTSLVLRMIEHGVDLDGFVFNNPLEVAKAATFLPNITKPYELTNGNKITPLEHQIALAELALQFIEIVEVPEDEEVMAHEWYQAGTDFKSAKDFTVLGDRVDWSTKLCIIDRKLQRNGGQSKVSVARGIDRLYGELSSKGIALKLRERGMFRDPLNAMELAPSMMTTPPEGRANLRGQLTFKLIRLNLRKSICERASVSWEAGRWKLRAQDERAVNMSSPFGDDRRELARIEQRFAELDRLVA